MAGLVQSIEPGSAADAAGLLPGDALLAVNGHAVQDVIDVQFYAAETDLSFEIERQQTMLIIEARREFGQALGLIFEHPTFDIDIRRCNNLCPFCFVLQNAPRMRRTLYIKDDDYRYSFLFGHFVTLTNLNETDWARIAKQHLSPLYISVHATDPDIRQRCLRNTSSGDILGQLRWLASHGIQMHTQLVVTPGLNDGAVLGKSIRDLIAFYPSILSVSVVPVGLTRFHKYGHRPHTVQEAEQVITMVEGFQHEFRDLYGVGFAYLSDEWYLTTNHPLPKKRDYDGLSLQANGLGMTRDFLNEWERVKRTETHAPISNLRHKRAILATATLFAPTLAKVARQFSERTGIPMQVVAIRNMGLGETITVAGLLHGADIIKQLEPLIQPDDGAIVILPRVTFDHPDGISLDDVTPLAIARALRRPVALADLMGDVLDALTGVNKLVFDPAVPELTVPVVREGGWAVEKYL
ncbi:MAG TPA: DUF512 domain-containing protein [Anaerolineae bacterium]